jgi:Aerobic-type carbon monoxide dehydrogenase, small subunit CoxS/CutS homologs
VGRHLVRIKVNGKLYEAEVEDRMLLVQFLRELAGARSVHMGCESGYCGACTVIMNGKLVKSCMILAVQADGADIMTVEALSQDGKLHPIQEAFRENFAAQCGYCMPGMIMATYYLLSHNPNPTEEEIKEAITGNICLCAGYQNIVKAIKAAAEKMRTLSKI